jgi:hypothetical protein
MVQDGVTGYLINTGNYKEIRRVVKLIQNSNPDALRKLTRDSVVQRTWSSINQELIQHYRDLIRLNIPQGSELVA